MGILGTGAAAGVAQTGLQAQQLGRQQARRAQDRAHILQRHQEIRETRLKALEEDDAAEAETALHVDGELPEHERHPDQQSAKQHDQPHSAQSASDEATSAEEDGFDETPATTYGPQPLPGQPTPSASSQGRLDLEA